jgi:nucleotide-binding universal stress UspA family protein
VKVAADVGADLNVMGTRGMTEWRSMLGRGEQGRAARALPCPLVR